MKIIIISIMLASSFFYVSGQHNILKGQEPNLQCIRKQKKELDKKVKKNKCFELNDDLNYLFIYTLRFKNRPTPNLFLEQRIMNELNFLYRKKNTFPIYSSIIYDKKKSVMGYSEDLNVYCFYNKNDSLIKKLELLIEYQLSNVFEKIYQIDATSSDLYFLEKEGKISALIFEKGQPKILNMQEFVRCCWDEEFPKDLLDILYR